MCRASELFSLLYQQQHCTITETDFSISQPYSRHTALIDFTARRLIDQHYEASTDVDFSGDDFSCHRHCHTFPVL